MKKLTLKRDFIANHTNVIMGALFWQKCVIRLWRGGEFLMRLLKKIFANDSDVLPDRKVSGLIFSTT